MAQMKAMIQNLISELISFLPGCTINEKDIKNLIFTLQRYLDTYIGIECIKQYEQLCGEILYILLGCWHHYLPHSYFGFKCTVPNFHTPFTSNKVDLFYIAGNE